MASKMKKRLISLFTALTVAACALPAVTSAAAEKAPKYQDTARQMERLNRGLIAVRTPGAPRNGVEDGVYLSWRLLGDESLSNQAFDIYRDGKKIHTTGPHDATNYVDKGGNENNVYKVVKAGASEAMLNAEPGVKPFREWNHTADGSYAGNGTSEKNSFSWIDIPLVRPANVKNHGGGTSNYYAGANDASVGDLDGDGDYEIVLKWDPSDSKDSASSGYTGNVYIDAYEISEDNGGYMWRIDLGKNIRAGAHYTQFMVYDLDGDGKSEIAMKTAPGSIDGTGRYVTEVGDSDAIRNADNNAVYLSGKGIPTKGGEYLTIFDGETGAALYTTDYISRNAGDWGDSKYNRSERYLAAVAYLNGETPSLIMCRGYYARAMVRAYDWDGEKLTMLWEHNGDKKGANSLYGQGNHNLSVADVDNDGRDEIVYGSAILDDNGVAFANTNMGHGDAMHVSDFNNDGWQEVFSVKESSSGNDRKEDFRNANTGKVIYAIKGSGDNGRGLMTNADDSYADTHPNGLALGWSAAYGEAHDLKGNSVGPKPKTNSRTMTNFAVYWDGDLGRELLDDNQLAKYHISDSGSYTGRFYNGKNGYLPASSNNSTKQNPSLTVDLWGDWREEIIMPVGKNEGDTPYLRVMTSTLPTEYRLTTLMHDSQYRTAIAWQNVAYNQPPHPSYYIGSAALATDKNGNKLNYLAPETPFTRVRYTETVPVESITLADEKVTVRENDTYLLKATIYPENASTYSIVWNSSDENVAKVKGGLITGIAPGTATITATTRDGGFTASCQVTVIRVNVEGISLSEENISVKEGGYHWLTAAIYPEDATRKGIIWASSDESIATVDDGRVTGVSAGSCTVTATAVDGGYFAICRVTVLPVDDIDMLDSAVFEGSSGEGVTVFETDRTSAHMKLENAPENREFYRNFIPFYKDTATLSFTFNTGGKKNSSDAWNWDGREYTFGFDFVDTFGNSILNISQAYTSGAQPTMAMAHGVDAEEIKYAWAGSGNLDAGGTNPMNRSSTTWVVTLEFNYDEDICVATIENIQRDIAYTKTFPLEGKNFERLRYYATVDGNGPISVEPNLSNLSYTLSTAEKDASVTIMSVSENTAEARIIGGSDISEAQLIGELYDADGNLVETKEITTDLPAVREIEFEKNIGEHSMKLSLYSGDELLAEASLGVSGKPDIADVVATDQPEAAHPIEHAYDGNLSTYWTSQGTNSITFELEKDAIFTGAKAAFMKYEDDRTIPFRIYTSDDGANWRQVYAGSSVVGSGDFIDCVVSPVETAKFVKVECDGNTVSGWTSLAEVEIYSSVITENDKEEEKRPKALTIVSATATKEPEAANPKEHAYDGKMDTVWTSQGKQSITFDLDKVYMITDVSVAFMKYEDDRTIPFRVYISTDGKTENKIYDGSSVPRSGGFIDIEVSPSSEARYVRVECDGNTVSGWTSLAEVMIYGFEIEIPEPDDSEYAIYEVKVNGAVAEVTLHGRGEALLVGALYKADGALEEVKLVDIKELPAKAEITFSRDIDGYELRLLLWNSREGLAPLVPAKK